MPGSPHVRHALKVDVRLTYCSPSKQSCRWPSKSWPGCMSPKVCTSKYATANGTKEASFLAIPPSIATALRSTLKTELGQRMLWTLTHYGAYVVDGGAGSFNMAFEAGPVVNPHGSTDSWQSAAADIAKAYNLTDGSDRQPPNWKFTALRVDRPGSDWSDDVDALERIHIVGPGDLRASRCFEGSRRSGRRRPVAALGTGARATERKLKLRSGMLKCLKKNALLSHCGMLMDRCMNMRG